MTPHQALATLRLMRDAIPSGWPVQRVDISIPVLRRSKAPINWKLLAISGAVKEA